MKKKAIGIVLALLLICSGCSGREELLLTYNNMPAPAFSLSQEEQPELMAEDLAVFDPEQLSGQFPEVYAALLVNSTSGQALYGEHVFDRLYPASITKIATAYVAFLYGNLDDTVTVSYEASHITEAGAKLCRFQEGDQMKLEELLHVMLVYSGNDAAMAVAEHISGSEAEFCELMNRELEKLGAVDTHFTNSHGLHQEDHYTTAYDIYLIFHELLGNEQFCDMIRSSSVTLDYTSASGQKQSRTFETTNRYLLKTAGMPEHLTVFGGKTGTTNAAGNCLVLGSTDPEGDQYISVILHAGTPEQLYQKMTELMDLSQ